MKTGSSVSTARKELRFAERTGIASLVAFAMLVFAITMPAAHFQWDKKPPGKWSNGDVLKVLNDSPWAKTHAIATIVELDDRRPSRSGIDPATHGPARAEIRFRIRLVSAKPVREALSRYVEQTDDENARFETRDLLDSSILENHDNQLIVMLACESDYSSRQFEELQNSVQISDTEKLKALTYVEVGKQRLELEGYRPWGRASAVLKFARTVGGQPVISKETASFRFRTKLGTSEIVATFKPSEMLYEGILEY